MALLYPLIVILGCLVARQAPASSVATMAEPPLEVSNGIGTLSAVKWRLPWKSLPGLVKILETVPEGRAILAAARAKDPNFLDHVHRGEASYTESTFARSYSLIDGRERIELHHEITLNERLPVAEAAVDLAHELVHFTEKAMLDPYKPGFELKEFVKRGIEGPGGELVALRGECDVAWALKAKFAHYPPHRLCAPYRKNSAFNEPKAKADYYALGNWMNRASDTLKSALPELSDQPVVFTSSYARKPYPIALSEEFAATREAACENNRKKYRLIAAQAETGRAPAANLLSAERRRLKTYERLYCRPSQTAAAD